MPKRPIRPTTDTTTLGIMEVQDARAFGGLVNGSNLPSVTRSDTGYLDADDVFVTPEPGARATLSGQELTFVDYRAGEMVWTDASGQEWFSL
ncbi:hypothetical protein [Deinococcus petrolearius]|uniref:Major tropism determinant N-terminal domain-containing protein n=1 Tax=Deinococcus petrolearius TaxID=1751295 RepID=A0ABW1DDH0_9DEIO